MIVSVYVVFDVRVQNENLKQRVTELEHQIQLRDSINEINCNRIDSLINL